MPLSTGMQGAAVSVHLEFDQPAYRPGDTIRFRVVVEGEPTSVTRDEQFTGTVTLPGQPPQEVSGTAQVVDGTVYGPFTADNYTVAQDPADPSQYTATPGGAS